jgi:hypothetical protein
MDVSRRLVAVFAADIEGYSRLMCIDEVATLQALGSSAMHTAVVTSAAAAAFSL